MKTPRLLACAIAPLWACAHSVSLSEQEASTAQFSANDPHGACDQLLARCGLRDQGLLDDPDGCTIIGVIVDAIVRAKWSDAGTPRFVEYDAHRHQINCSVAPRRFRATPIVQLDASIQKSWRDYFGAGFDGTVVDVPASACAPP